MFTGIVQGTGKVFDIQTSRLWVEGPWFAQALSIGQSIAIDGCCLTLVDAREQRMAFDLSPETLDKTLWGQRRIGDRVNLEKSLTPTSLMDGHMVTGHIDALGHVKELRQVEDGCWQFDIAVPPDLCRYLVSKGSVAVNGVSLTVNWVSDTGFSFMCIPHTYQHTNLSDLRVGDAVNLETDIVAKYVAKQLAHTRGNL